MSSDVFNLGHIIVAFVRGKYQKVIIHQVEEMTLDNEGFRRDHKVVKKSFERAMLYEDLKAIVDDFKIIEKKPKP